MGKTYKNRYFRTFMTNNYFLLRKFATELRTKTIFIYEKKQISDGYIRLHAPNAHVCRGSATNPFVQF